MATYIRKSRGYTYTNATGSTIVAGTPLVSQKLFGVVSDTIAPGAVGWVDVDGVWSLPCGDSVTASVGALAYWDATNSKITATASTNLPVGYFAEAVASGTTTCAVILGVGLQAAAGVGS